MTQRTKLADAVRLSKVLDSHCYNRSSAVSQVRPKLSDIAGINFGGQRNLAAKLVYICQISQTDADAIAAALLAYGSVAY